MKRILTLGLVVSIIMVLCLGCANEKTLSENFKTNEQSQSSLESNENNQIEETYKQLTCRAISKNQMTSSRIIDKKTGLMLQLYLPSDWVLSKVNGSTFDILRSGNKIGVLTTDALPKEDNRFERLYINDTIEHSETEWYIAHRNENGQDKFYREFCIKGNYFEKNCSVNISVDYTELDKDTTDDIAVDIKTVVPQKKLLPLSQTNGSKTILILGNSFISSSQIGQFLNDMLQTANKEYSVNAVSWGMANLGTFASNNNICNSIKNGEYCYVFQCGFYSSSAVDNFGKMKQYCDASNTPLIIFPAHNESKVVVKNTFFKYENSYILDWMGKVQLLIDSGVAPLDMYVNDSHKHSTPLAGYVGACMIYKMVFGENPPAITARAPLSAQYVNSKLSAYKDIVNSTDVFNGKSYEIN